MTNLKDKLLSSEEVARILSYNKGTLAHWRCKGIGPKFEKLETGVIRYKESEVMKWVESQSVESKIKENNNF